MRVNCAHTEIVDIDLLVPNPRNPNKHSEKQIQLLAKLIKHHGWRHPVVVSKRSGFVCAGHGRIEAAKLNGWDKVPVDYQDFETEADEYSFLVSDNTLAELAELDLAMVNEDIVNLGPDFDLELLGMPDFVLEPAEKFELDDKPDKEDGLSSYIIEVQFKSESEMVEVYEELLERGLIVRSKV